MAAQPKTQWGLFPPLSTALPTEAQLKQNDDMIEELKRNKNFESPAETQKRSEVLRTFQRAVVEFVKVIGKRKGMSDAQLKDAGGKVTTFGSFRLGAYGPGSDIDTCIVAPKFVSRKDFFDYFLIILERLSDEGAVEDVKKVPDAHVPIIKMEYSGISMDVIFACLQLNSVPFNLDMKDDGLIRGLDDQESRCINGARVSDMLISLVPQEKTFRHALRTIKLWAQRRGIYGNVFGFPGGIAWAIMVASVCQSYPQACGSVVVGKFFNLIGAWQWPRPIMLKSIEDSAGGVQKKVWNPVLYRSDKGHLMPVITPAFPCMCATHNITRSTKQVIMRELKRGAEITSAIYAGKAQWSDLFRKHSFFTDGYKHYLCIVTGGRTKEAQAVWSGLIESKVRKLVSGIEDGQVDMEEVRPFVQGYSRVHQARNEEEIDSILQGRLDYMVKDSKAETPDIASQAMHQAVATQENNEQVEQPAAESDGNGNGEEKKDEPLQTTIYTTTYYVGIRPGEGGSKSLDISYPVGDFVRQCSQWNQFNSEMHSVRVVHARPYDLAEDVFEAGETKPSRSKRSKGGVSGKDGPDKKRVRAEPSADVSAA